MIGKLGRFAASAIALGATPSAQWALFWRQTKNVRVRLGLATYHAREVFSVETRLGTLHFRDNFGDITNVPGLLHEQVYRPPVVVGDGTILDVGANIGLAAAWLRHTYPGRPVHCFEPLAENAALVPLNCPGAHVHNVAVGAAAGTVALAVDADAVMASTIDYARAAGTRTIDVVTLDEHVRAHGIERVAFLKIDTEGMELDVLRGATDTLARTGVIALETHERHRHDEVLALLRAHGFRIDRERMEGRTGFVFASQPAQPADQSRDLRGTGLQISQSTIPTRANSGKGEARPSRNGA